MRKNKLKIEMTTERFEDLCNSTRSKKSIANCAENGRNGISLFFLTRCTVSVTNILEPRRTERRRGLTNRQDSRIRDVVRGQEWLLTGASRGVWREPVNEKGGTLVYSTWCPGEAGRAPKDNPRPQHPMNPPRLRMPTQWQRCRTPVTPTSRQLPISLSLQPPLGDPLTKTSCGR